MLVWEGKAGSSVFQQDSKAFAPLWRWSVSAKGHHISVPLNWKQNNISVWNGLTRNVQWASGKTPFVIFPVRTLPIAPQVKNWLFSFSSSCTFELLCVEWCMCRHYDSLYKESYFSSMHIFDVHDTFSLILIPRSLTAAAVNASVNRNCEISH